MNNPGSSSSQLSDTIIRPENHFYTDNQDPFAGAFWSQFQDPHDLASQHIPSDSSPAAAMRAYRKYRDRVRKPVLATYTILGFLSSGTYGRVYKARLRTPNVGPGGGAHVGAGLSNSVQALASSAAGAQANKKKGGLLLQQHQLLDSPSATSSLHATPNWLVEAADGQIFAIKKFKPDTKETDSSIYTGISQSAMREISLNRELCHVNIVTLHQVMLEDKSIYMVFEYAEHDLLQIIHYHSTALRAPIPLAVLKSLLWQLINGVAYLHANWILHRDLKPANILVTCRGVVKIGDLGLARLYTSPLQSLYNGDKVVVTIWYRAPELLLGSRHYTTAIDIWSVGCIWGELLALRPMFKGEEAKMDPKTKAAPFQTDQLKRIVEVLGTPNKDELQPITL
uniref:Cyclin-dependent kinase 8 n=1 Tax=Melanopsichium pennsylvanicum 4 TaxID=1398559 RepID=A0A077R4K2_9BASI|nr:related to SSN3-cyclin-dependent CTD kinase [Melanopsichium pennsylvanicum 4]